jgi:hypothetical protein
LNLPTANLHFFPFGMNLEEPRIFTTLDEIYFTKAEKLKSILQQLILYHCEDLSLYRGKE